MISEAGIALIRRFEGCSLTAYPDPGTGDEPWTIGYGHTGPEVRQGMTITQEEADAYLVDDLRHFEECVNNAVDVPLTQGQFDACVSLAYNIGCRSFSTSTLVRLLNARNPEAARQQFGRWNKSGGRVMDGLTKRRQAEAELFGTS